MSEWLLRFFSTIWYALLFGIILPISLALVGISLDQYLESWLNFSLSPSLWWWLAGGLFWLCGLLLMAVSSWTLYKEGKGYPWSFGSHAAYNPQVLVKSGPYSVVRHPMATSYLLLLLGLGCFIPSIVLLVWLVPLAGGLFYEYLEFTEEVHLRRWFGDEYEEYHRSTPSLLPHHWVKWRPVRKSRVVESQP